MSETNNIFPETEMQEIIGNPPAGSLRWGSGFVFSFFTIVIIMSFFLYYPDVINGGIQITTENPPLNIVAKSSGRLKMLVNDHQKVGENTLLAVIENPANFKNVLKLKASIHKVNVNKVLSKSLIEILEDLEGMELGELQIHFSTFKKKLNEYSSFEDLNYHEKKINIIESQLRKYKQLQRNTTYQLKTRNQELALFYNKYKIDSISFYTNVVTLTELERSQSIYLQKRYEFENVKSNLINIEIQISDLENNIIENQLNFKENKTQLFNDLNGVLDDLEAQIEIWEGKYLLYSPIQGEISFFQYNGTDQFINSGDNVLTIIPLSQGEIIGVMMMPTSGSGKVKIGQRVVIKLVNYPYEEFGMIRGVVKEISLLSNDNEYKVEVVLPESLNTTYNISLEFKQQMNGNADIITENRSLFKRMFNQFFDGN